MLLLAPELYLPVRMVGQHFHASTDGLEAAGRLFAALDTPAAVSAPARPLPAPDVRTGAIELEDVRVAYPGRGEPVLDGLHLRIEPGELVGARRRERRGQEHARGAAAAAARPGRRRRRCATGSTCATSTRRSGAAQLAWVPQRATLFSGTVADNIRLGVPDAPDDARRARASPTPGSTDLVAGLPDGLATRVGEGGRALSAGEAQRVGLARAFLRDAPLLVLDEPTAHLDAATAADVGAAVERLAAGRTTLLIAHDVALARRADRVLRLAGGVLLPRAAGAAS